ncbi:MAG: SH3 domain-containing protein [Defluviitaleaceae bacterium]|nr:SH3 domain-containing protein [Defluviitaleaceae bacterium]
MRKWLLGIAMLAGAAIAFTPVSVQASPYEVPYNWQEQGYIPYEYIDTGIYNEPEAEQEPEMPKVFRTTANLNLRQAPSTDAALIVTVNRGRLVYVTDLRDGEWFSVTVSGQTGYMYAAFLEEVPMSATAEGEIVISEINGTVERLHWSDARQLTTIGTTLTIVDVRTGITWQMASFSNGNHADVEPLTAADTTAMLQAWGGRWCWTPRPVHVIIGDRVLAASLNGMPHAGWTRQGNNMNGHVCLHFYGSRTHNGNRRHERDHQNAVTEAFNAGN